MSEQAPILITGIPRSGTTMIAATINACGAFAGEMSKRGMYSNDRIREELVKIYLEMIRINLDYIPINWKISVEYIMEQQGYKEGPWMYKDSNLSKMWKVWNKFYPDAKWIIVRRRTGDIIQSCMKTGYMTEHSTEKGWLQMVHEYEARFVEMITEGLNCKIIWPERMIDGDLKQLYEVIEWLGLTWNKEALKFIDPLLWGKKERSKK
jgi:hypothetical protein